MRLAYRLAFGATIPALMLASASAFAQFVSPTAQVVDGSQMQLDRYSTATAAPATVAAQPLAAMVRLSYPRQTITTVGEAIEHTLDRSGWRLVGNSALGPQAQRLLTLSLPDSQRTLGPYSVRTVLEILTGPAWQWQEDEVQRLVWFELRPEYLATSTQATQPGTARQVTADESSQPAVAHPVPPSPRFGPDTARASTNCACAQPHPVSGLAAALDGDTPAAGLTVSEKRSAGHGDKPQSFQLPWDNPNYVN